MKTKYNTDIPDKLTVEYIDYLIGKVFSLLYMFEENSNNDNFIITQQSLIQIINGNTSLIKYNDVKVVDILSRLETLENIKTHNEYRRCILKVCKLLTELKKGVESHGL